MCKNVYSSTVHSSKNLDPIQVLISWKTNKHMEVYSPDGLLSASENESPLHTWIRLVFIEIELTYNII